MCRQSHDKDQTERPAGFCSHDSGIAVTTVCLISLAQAQEGTFDGQACAEHDAAASRGNTANLYLCDTGWRSAQKCWALMAKP